MKDNFSHLTGAPLSSLTWLAGKSPFSIGSRIHLHMVHMFQPVILLCNDALPIVSAVLRLKQNNQPAWLTYGRGISSGGERGVEHGLALRIQVCPKKGITPTFLFFSDGIGAQNILFDREGSGSLGLFDSWNFCVGSKYFNTFQGSKHVMWFFLAVFPVGSIGLVYLPTFGWFVW